MTRVVPPSGERVEPTKRRKMTKARALRIWEREGGLCYLCGHPVTPTDDLEIEHPTDAWFGGSDDDMALRPVHVGCHRVKTDATATVRAKVKRIIARLDGTRRPRKPIPSRPFGKQKRPWPTRKFPT